MKKKLARKIFGPVFLFIFFSKMVISVAPIIADHLDNNCINAVIMQLEIEHSPAKSSESAKELSSKGDWISLIQHYNFSRPLIYLSIKTSSAKDDAHVQTFYPPVPTPPPSA